MRVLLVDDDRDVVEGLLLLLGMDLPEAEVVAALDGASALRLLKEQSRFDVVLCDIVLPDMVGTEVALAARRHDATSVIGCISIGATAPDDVFDFGLAKPFEISELIDAMSAALSRRRAGG